MSKLNQSRAVSARLPRSAWTRKVMADGKLGMILSVLGDRPRAVGVDREGLMQMVRWRPLP